MGMLDRLLKKESKKEEVVVPEEEEKITTLRNGYTREGRDFFEYYDRDANFRSQYDTTDLVLCKVPRTVDGKKVYDCMVTWYKEGDTMFYDEENQIDGIARDYQHIIAEIDPNQMRNDPDYFICVMKELLKKDRVNGFLENAMKTEAELAEERSKEGKETATLMPHGRYVGGIIAKNGMWKKGYDISLGETMHNLPEMQAERENYRREQEAAKMRRIREKRAQIAMLEEEIQAEQER